jgi:hypothetical protein|tara:strand:+ start:692 stop:901 length:210 start_codon:yes stop_codon:yes gene_type:complete
VRDEYSSSEEKGTLYHQLTAACPVICVRARHINQVWYRHTHWQHCEDNDADYKRERKRNPARDADDFSP